VNFRLLVPTVVELPWYDPHARYKDRNLRELVHNGLKQPCSLWKFCEKWPLPEIVFLNYFYDLANIVNLFVIFKKEMPLQIFFVH
jgi:hypothetical protein